MIFDRVSRRSCYRDFPALAEALGYFASLPRGAFPAGQAALARGVLVNPVCFSTKPEAECRFEGHRLFADVHFLLEGEEKIVLCDESRGTPLDEFDEPRDIGFFACPSGTALVLRPGDFLVCFPHELHKVAVAPGLPAPCRKLVAKLPVFP